MTTVNTAPEAEYWLQTGRMEEPGAELGIRKPVIKAHGASDVLAFRNAVKQAADVAASDITGELEENLQRLAAQKEKVTEHD